MKRGNLCSSSSSISTSPNLMNHLLCKHEIPAILRKVKKGIHVGKKFYGCSLWPDNGCGFFEFEDKVLDDSGLQMDFLEMKRNLEEKIEKLIMKNEKLKEDIMASRIQIRKHCQGEKIAMTLLLISWIFFLSF
ncbi:hypothetical protein KSS87_000654 [Heliosperma pusillum]|nr:hypothetical protein KSS87_000654 [Heliosperma pusillum]